MSNEETSFELPESGFLFWPVGTGDSTTICVDPDSVMQVDLRHLSSAEDEDDPHAPIIDRLEESLPTRDGESYLAVFLLTHPDQDHCLGFEDLLDRIHIGEIWFTPRIFREYTKDLCDDAKAFRKEAKRRVKETIDQDGDAESGNRVRIIGYDDLLAEDDYKDFPEERLTVPGNTITELDAEEHEDNFRAFVHAPFKDDAAGERNDTSVSLQITLSNDDASGRLLFFGDLAYPTIRNVFDRSDDEDLKWNVMLSAHHCSKSVMYQKNENGDNDVLKRDILDEMERVEEDDGRIISSSEPVPGSNKVGDNPPHAKAKRRYEEIAQMGFWCTQEYPNEDKPEPMVFELTSDGLQFDASEESKDEAAAKATASATGIATARGNSEPPQDRVGFGNHD